MITFAGTKPLTKLIPTISHYYTSATFLHHLHHSISTKSLLQTQQSHARVCHLGLTQHSVTLTKLISAYAVCKNPRAAKLVFDSVRVKNVFLWNTLINGYAKNGLCSESLKLFREMWRNEGGIDGFTISIIAKVCGDFREGLVGELVFGLSVRAGFGLDVVVGNAFMFMYCECGRFWDAYKVFDEMPERSVSSWNVMIGGFSGLGGDWVWGFVRRMVGEGFGFDGFTLSSLIPLCGRGNGVCEYGRELHCYIVKNDGEFFLESDFYLGCCLIDMYGKSGRVNVGRNVFEGMKVRNVFAWTAMISGYVQNGEFDEAMFLFGEMQSRGGIEPNKVSLISVLPACSSVGGLLGGRQVHGFAVRKELNYEVSLCNALIDMYSKCGSLNYARRVFDFHCISKDAISWSSMISGYGLHGKGRDALLLYHKMLQSGIKPDFITVVGVLSACGRSEMVEEGLNIYNSIDDYGLKPTLEICACIVDMLGRSGQLDKALDFIKKMPLEPGPSIWGSLVNASILHGNSDMLDLAYKFLIQVEPANPSNYVSLSNLYALSRDWDAVAEVRAKMKERGLKKLPGCSWISINNEMHSFYVADKAHPCSEVIYEMLQELIPVMKGVGSSTIFEDLASSYLGQA
ncbi:pentatricopeptide repeat-containing protein At3g12770-like [Apium graveolens]|uniref:pentatricopeptide repeat-containing protein At3g12770-like n=1 Tax=Apium graveolens TaxID=4045 RepID=UPI003D7AAA77